MTARPIHLAATSARIGIGALVAVACVLGVAGAAAAPWPELSTQPDTAAITPVPGDTVLVCNGSFRALGRDASQAGLMVSAAAPRLQLDSPQSEAQQEPLEMPEVTGGVGAQSITGTVQHRQAPLIAASEMFQLDQPDLRGYAAAPCREASIRSWLVGGDVSTGASDVILLSNATSVPATVELNVYGQQRAASTAVVPPLTQVGLPLASVSAGEQRPVIEVVSSGAPVRASLQSALTRTLDPVGIDLQDGMGGPQRELEILGVQSSPAAAGDDSTGVVLRLLSPGAGAQATVRLRAVGSDAVLQEYPVLLEADAPGEIALSGLRAGAYDIEVTATEPIVAAARQSVRVGAREDFAWMLPAPQLTGTTMFSIPRGAPATLYLRNPSQTPLTVVIDGEQGQQVEVPAEGGKALAVRVGAHTLRSDDPVHAAIGIRGGEGSAAIAGWPLWAPPATQKPIIVRH